MIPAAPDPQDPARTSGPLPKPSTAAVDESGRRRGSSPGLAASRRLAELTDALGRVRRLYCDNAAKRQILDALDNLIGCACIHFAEEARRGDHPPRRHPEAEKPDNVLHYMLLLREYVERFDKFGLLSDLHFLDCWLEELIAGEQPADRCQIRRRRLAPLTTSR